MTRKRRTIGAKTARKMLTGARKRRTEAERDEAKAKRLLDAAQKRAAIEDKEKDKKRKCKGKTKTRRKTRTRSGTLS